MTRILLLEDDRAWADWLARELKGEFSDVRILAIPTEAAFLRLVDELEKSPPDLMIADLILRWDSLDSGTTLPSDYVQSGGRFQAGFRCVEELRKRKALQEVPVVVMSVRSAGDVEERVGQLSDTLFVSKSDSGLVLAIRSLLASQIPLPPRPKGDLTSQIWGDGRSLNVIFTGDDRSIRVEGAVNDSVLTSGDDNRTSKSTHPKA